MHAQHSSETRDAHLNLPFFYVLILSVWEVQKTYVTLEERLNACFRFCFTVLYVHSSCASNHPVGEEIAGCFTRFVFLVSRDFCVALPYGAMGLSAVCYFGIS